MKTSKEESELVIPVYLNEKIIIDMLAIIEDGFSQVRQIETNQTQLEGEQNKIAGSAGTNSFLSGLLAINISGEKNKELSNKTQEKVSSQKIHTNVSLFSKFREYLIDNNLVKNSYDINKLKIGEFVEFTGELRKNPFIDLVEKVYNLMKFSEIFKQESKGKNNKSSTQTSLKQIATFKDGLSSSGTIDFIVSNETNKVILSVQEKYLSNDNISEILGGHFKVIGKVIAVYKTESESVNLLRKTSLSPMKEEFIKSYLDSMSSLGDNQFDLPKLETRISGPAIIVIPIAIFS